MTPFRALAFVAALASGAPALAQQAPLVVQTASGLRYQMLAPGEGVARPTDDDIVLINYEGKLADGATFDKSTEPTAMLVRNVVPGFSEALKLMPRGAKYRVWIPPVLGYGAEAMRGPDGAVMIPGNATLAFDIELVDFMPEADMAAASGEPNESDIPSHLAEPAGAPDPAETGFTQTASGLRIKTLTPAKESAHPSDADAVLIHYIGRLSDGTVFDRSVGATPMAVNAVIKGFSEGLKLMSRGGTYRVWVKPDLAYGAEEKRGPDGSVALPANSTLIFDVELIDFIPEAELLRMQQEAARESATRPLQDAPAR